MRRRSYAVLWVASCIVLLGGLYWCLKPSMTRQDMVDTHFRTYRLSISTPQLRQESPILMATQGDTVTLVIRSDRPGELHVHGYQEQMITLKPVGEVRLTFTAKDAGRFPVHLHDPDGTMHDLAFLEVQPK